MNPVTALCGWFTWKSEDFVKKNEKTWTKALLPTQVELSMWIKEEEGERKKRLKKLCAIFKILLLLSIKIWRQLYPKLWLEWQCDGLLLLKK